MRRDRIVALGLGLFAIIYLVASWRLPRFALSTGVVDSHVFPLILGAALLLLSLIYFLQSGGPKDTSSFFDGVNLPLLVKMMLATVGYALILERLGFVVATAIFLFATMALLGLRGWLKMSAISAGFAVGVYALFAYVLEVQLARGILPF